MAYLSKYLSDNLGLENLWGLAPLETDLDLQGTSHSLPNFSILKKGISGALSAPAILFAPNVFDGDANDNVLTGTSKDDILNGFAGDDILYGLDGVDQLFGGDDDDDLYGGEGGDLLDGGLGEDTVYYTNAKTGVLINLDDGTTDGNEAAGDVFVSIENVSGSAFADMIYGDGGNNSLDGGAGDDELYGGAGQDFFVGGAGADHMDGGADVDYVSYHLSAVGVTVNLIKNAGSGGDAEGDTFVSIERLGGSLFDDVLTGINGSILYGNGGNDTLYGASGRQQMNGGDGDDTFVGGEGNDSLSGGNGGFDTVDYSLDGGALAIIVDLSTGGATDTYGDHDTLSSIEAIIGTDLDDVITGNTFDNTFEGGLGADTLDGGDGVDTASYENASSGVTVDLDAGVAANEGAGTAGEALGDLLISIENVIGSEFADTLIGNNEYNILYGRGGNDTLVGGSGGPLGDTLDGGSGVDTVDYSLEQGVLGITVNLLTGTATDTYGFTDTLVSIEAVIGTDENDIFIGDSSYNVFEGGEGADVFNGNGGVDVLIYRGSTAGVNINLSTLEASGGEAQGDSFQNIENVAGSDHKDVLVGDTLDNALSGYAGDDEIYGNNGNDVLFGHDGNDTLVGGSGNDVLGGGIGVDTVDYSAEGALIGVMVDLLSGTATDGHGDTDTLTQLENVIGTVFSDTLIGNADVNVLAGNDGDDVVTGGAGDDTLNGGAGIDTLDYSIDGGALGVIVDLVNSTADDSHGNTDTLSNFENIIGTAFADFLVGADGNNVLTGGAGADSLQGGGGFDTASYALSGSRVIVSLVTNTGTGGDAEGDTLVRIERLTGSAFDDRFEGDGNVNILTGNDGDDILDGGANNDTLIGGDNDDHLTGGAGGDVLNGGSGHDTISYLFSLAAVDINLFTSVVSGGDAHGDTIIDIESVEGSTFADTLTGDKGDNNFFGGRGDDILFGGLGDDNLSGGDDNDTLVGEADDDYIDGGDGIDTVDYSMDGGLFGVNVHLSNGPTTDTHGHTDTLVNIENIIGTDLHDILAGDNGVNTLHGGGGTDTLDGNNGDDFLYGGAGADYLVGGAGGDVLDGGAGRDAVAYNGSTAGVSINLQANTASGGHANGDVLTSIEDLVGSFHNDTLVGDAGRNIIFGANGDDALFGNAGDDELFGEQADDTLTGGAGADEINGGAGEDTAAYLGSTAGVFVDLSHNITIGGHAEGDTLSNIENLTGSTHDDILGGDDFSNRLTGNAGDDILLGYDGGDLLAGNDGNDILYGGAGVDTLTGGAGSDRLNGGTGSDKLTGGSGADSFVIMADAGDDLILDFEDGVDHIEFGDGVYSFAQLKMVEAGGDVLIYSENGMTRVSNMSLADFDVSDFVFQISSGEADAQNSIQDFLETSSAFDEIPFEYNEHGVLEIITPDSNQYWDVVG